MKSYFLILTITLTGCLSLLKAQNVNIPDANFKASLVNNPAINTNGDTAIQVNEASAYTGALFVNNLNIQDLTGISAFVNIDSLNCSWNLLTSLDVSANIALTTLLCNMNYLTSLNLAANNALTYLEYSRNQITTLNLSLHTALTYLGCGDNQITSLNLTANTALTSLGCGSN